MDKIGNLIIYLVDEIEKKYRQKVFLTKLLKLVYLIDETAVKDTGVPVTGLEYRVWRMGPVPYEIYKDLMHDNSEKLSFFAEAHKKAEGEWALIKSVNRFDYSDFSDYEMTLIDHIIRIREIRFRGGGTPFSMKEIRLLSSQLRCVLL